MRSVKIESRVFVIFTMSDPQSRLVDYQRRAAACVIKAEQATDEIGQNHYKQLADMYLQLVTMELRRMELRKPLVLPGG